jgi:hypothetical protein
MAHGTGLPYEGMRAVLATMHGKERVIAPVLQQNLGLSVVLPAGLDTDRFGTFSREIARSGSQLEAAREKISAAFDADPTVGIGVANEGSFGPHPLIPFVSFGIELVVLIDRVTGFELIGQDSGPDTNFSQQVVPDIDAAIAFAERSGFPGHGLIVIGCVDGQPAPACALIKDITDAAGLQVALRKTLAVCGSAFIETDMRAHRNPTRMLAIERATRDLVRRFMSKCPACNVRGFDVTERIAGLPCEWCGGPTSAIRQHVAQCYACGHREERPATTSETADPGQCDFCNP